MNYVFYYAEAHLACIILLALILIKIFKGVNKQASQLYLGHLVIILIFYFISEIFWVVVDGYCSRSSHTLLYLSNIFTYILIALAAYYWYIVSEHLQMDTRIDNPLTRRFLVLPVFVSAVLCITAFRTGWAFYIDESGNLVNGKLYIILVIVPFGYMIAASIKAFMRFANKDKYAERGIYFMIGVFPFAPITLGILQTIYWRVPFMCYGAVLAVYYVYITTQENLISIDPLTQTNNRNQMYKYLVQKMKNEEKGLSLFLLMIDIDRFRAINDSYGHVEGDRVLNIVASSVKEACQGSRNRMFVSRYGGDEFVVVAEMSYRAEATWLADQIKNNLRRTKSIEGVPYELSVSIGIAQYDYQAPVSIPTFIARADSDLYQNKKMNGT